MLVSFQLASIRDNLKHRTNAWATIALIAVNVLIFVMMVQQPECTAFDCTRLLGFSPQEAASFFNAGPSSIHFYQLMPERISYAFSGFHPLLVIGGLLSLVTMLFLHSHLPHLVFNMVSLYVFGTAVESKVGWKNFLKLYFGIGFLANFTLLMMFPMLHSPISGASSVTFGLMGMYLTFWPRAKAIAIFIIGLPSSTVPFVPLPWLREKIYVFWGMVFYLVSSLILMVAGRWDPHVDTVHISSFIIGAACAFILMRFYPSLLIPEKEEA
jgi:membrane associated rhomboid family serine protease